MMFRRGFTLIEVLIVIAIIGILLAIAIPNIQRWNQEDKDRKNCLEWQEQKTDAMICEAENPLNGQRRCVPEVKKVCVKKAAETPPSTHY